MTSSTKFYALKHDDPHSCSVARFGELRVFSVFLVGTSFKQRKFLFKCDIYEYARFSLPSMYVCQMQFHHIYVISIKIKFMCMNSNTEKSRRWHSSSWAWGRIQRASRCRHYKVCKFSIVWCCDDQGMNVMMVDEVEFELNQFPYNSNTHKFAFPPPATSV